MTNLRIVVYILALAMPFEAIRLPGDTSLLRLLGLIATAAFIFDYFGGPSNSKNKLVKNHDLVMLCIAFAIMAISLTYSTNKIAGFSLLANLLSTLLLYFYLRMALQTSHHVEKFLVILCGGFLLSMAAAYLVQRGVLPIAYDVEQDLRISSQRVTGFLRNPNRLGYYALMVFWLASALFFIFKRSKWFAFITMLCCAAIIIETQSRASMVALAVSICAFLLTRYGALKTLFFTFTIFATTLIVSDIAAFTGAANIVETRFSDQALLGSGSSYARISLWSYAIDTIARSPILGVGLGALDGTLGDEGFTIHDPHNTALYVQMYFGLPGTTMFAFIIISSALACMRLPRAQSDTRSITLSLLVAMVTPGLFHTTLFWKPFIISLCIIVLLVGATRVSPKLPGPQKTRPVPSVRG